MSIKLGFIVPIGVLEFYAGLSDYHLVLAHMVRDSSEYRDYYRKRSEDGDFITLDNSSYELGDGVFSEEDLLEFADAVKAKEIMAPEHYQDHEITVEKVGKFLDVIKTKNADMKVFGTIHGSSYSNYLTCLDRFLDLKVDTIGLSCRLNCMPIAYNIVACEHSTEWISSSVRMNLTMDMSARFFNMRYPDVPAVHLLGLNQPCELAFQTRWDFVRSNDSSAAYLAGCEGNNVTGFLYRKPMVKIDFYEENNLQPNQTHMIAQNINDLKELAGQGIFK